MDWVDYKRVASRYRPVYWNLPSHLDKLVSSAIGNYAKYRRMSIDGVIEYEVIRQYGIFLWHIAEMESLTVGTTPTKHEKTNIDWGLVETGLHIIRDRKEHNCDDTEIVSRVSGWVRRIYPMIASERIFKDAIIDNRALMIEKYHY